MRKQQKLKSNKQLNHSNISFSGQKLNTQDSPFKIFEKTAMNDSKIAQNDQTGLMKPHYLSNTMLINNM